MGGRIEQRELQYYRRPDGARPALLWLRDLHREAAARVWARLARARLGNMGDHKTVGQGVCEMRLDIGPGYRLYFGLDGPRTIILLIGGDKASQRRDIDLAKRYWMDYKRRTHETKH